jgi:4a-hydroxytetrahydrobiopterin dehydratase
VVKTLELAKQNCEPIRTGTEPIRPEAASEFASGVPLWTVIGEGLSREVGFEGFAEAMEFANAVAKLAEQQDHHPRICVDYSTVQLLLVTHKIGGLSKNDFIMAAKIDTLVD